MAGRILSKENEKKLRNATDLLAAVLKLLDKEAEAASDEAKEAATSLSEAANLGNWLESRIHLGFTEIADEMFGAGLLNRDERITLSGAIGEALGTFNAFIAANMPQLYEREPFQDSPDPAEVSEAAITEDCVALVERVLRTDGTIPIKLIAPGWGSSGYYSKEVLERDGPLAFPAGTKQFWNHATPAEEAQRPEGDLNALAAELVGPARWAEGPAGEGLYADAKVFGPYQAAINELAPHIGVSIRAIGSAVMGEAEGRKGRIITALTAGKSVDFVTEAGAGGQIVEMFEAARVTAAALITPQEGEEMNETKLQEAIAKIDDLAAANARLSEALILRDARDLTRTALEKSRLPAITQGRLLVQVTSAALPLKEGALDTATLLERVQAAIGEETAYIAAIGGYGGGRVEGMGHSAAPEPSAGQVAATASLTESFKALGLSEQSAAMAAAGR